jgi:hypothetical protein
LSPRAWRLAAVAAFALAFVTRALLLEAKPFWRDEAWVAALSLEPFDPTMSGPRKAVPVGFLALTKLAGDLPLPPEVALRLLPFAGGLAAILALAALARRLGCGRGTATVVLWLGAGLQAFVYYSRELKPYSLDLLIAGLAPLLALQTLRSRGPVRRRREAWLALAGLALVSPWMSFGSLLCVPATLGVATLLWWPRAGSAARRAWTGVVLAWLASVAALYAVALGVQSTSSRMVSDWAGDMAFLFDAPPVLRPLVGLRAYLEILLVYLFHEAWVPAVILVAIGFVGAPRAARRVLGGLALATAVATIAAALAHRYVLAQGRLLLFAAPPVVILLALGLQALGRRLSPRRGPALALAAAALAATAWSAQAIRHRLPPYRDDPRLYFRFDILHDVEPLIESARLLAAPGEPVFVSRYTGEIFRYYRRGRLPQATVCTRSNCRNEPPVVYDWALGVERRGFMIVLDADDGPDRRAILEDAGCDAWIAAQARGARLLRVTRRTPRAGG